MDRQQPPLSLSIPGGSHPQSRRRSQSNAQLPSYSLLGALEFRTAVKLLRQHSSTSLNALETSPITPYAAGHYPPLLPGHPHTHAHPHGHVRSGSGHGVIDTEVNPWDANLETLPLDERPGLSELGQSHASLRPHSRIQSTRSPSRLSVQSEEEERPNSPTTSLLSSLADVNIRFPSKDQRAKSAFVRALHILFPTLHHFTEKSVLGMIAALFAVPAVLALTLTLPVVVTPRGETEEGEKGPPTELVDANIPQLGNLIDFEEDGVERPLVAEETLEEELSELDFNKWLMAVQCVLGPMFAVAVLLGMRDHCQ